MIKSPFPYFGGKLKVAATVWARFGDVQSYIEMAFVAKESQAQKNRHRERLWFSPACLNSKKEALCPAS